MKKALILIVALAPMFACERDQGVPTITLICCEDLVENPEEHRKLAGIKLEKIEGAAFERLVESHGAEFGGYGGTYSLELAGRSYFIFDDSMSVRLAGENGKKITLYGYENFILQDGCIYGTITKGIWGDIEGEVVVDADGRINPVIFTDSSKAANRTEEFLRNWELFAGTPLEISSEE